MMVGFIQTKMISMYCIGKMIQWDLYISLLCTIHILHKYKDTLLKQRDETLTEANYVLMEMQRSGRNVYFKAKDFVTYFKSYHTMNTLIFNVCEGSDCRRTLSQS